MENKLGIFSFFSGAGFLDLGFEKTKSYDILFVNEIHKPFMDIYKYARKEMNINTPKFGYSLADITTFLNQDILSKLKNNVKTAKEEYPFVGFIGGPPCPDFSVAGKNKGKEGENGKLSGTYVNLICQVQPDFFLFENVKGLYRTKKHREFFDELKTKMSKAGYSMTERLINAIEYGAPQDRERIILIGFHKNMVKKLSLKTLGKELTDFKWGHKIYELTDILEKQWPKTTSFLENSDSELPNNIIEELTVQYWFNKNDVEHHPNNNQYFIPRQGLQRFLEIKEGDDKKKSYKRLHRWRYSPTAAYGNNEVHLHPYKARRLSIAEALSIQSLPKEFVLPADVTLTNAFKAIGNGVPYIAAKALALSIYDYINEHLKKDKE